MQTSADAAWLLALHLLTRAAVLCVGLPNEGLRDFRGRSGRPLQRASGAGAPAAECSAGLRRARRRQPMPDDQPHMADRRARAD